MKDWLMAVKHFLKLKCKEMGIFVLTLVGGVSILLAAAGIIAGIVIGLAQLAELMPYVFCYLAAIVMATAVWLGTLALLGGAWFWLSTNWELAKALAMDEKVEKKITEYNASKKAKSA